MKKCFILIIFFPVTNFFFNRNFENLYWPVISDFPTFYSLKDDQIKITTAPNCADNDNLFLFNFHAQKLHLEMLSDKSRTEAYRQVILNNSTSLRNKAVMDLGCGTGIISLFCARLAQPSAVKSTM